MSTEISLSPQERDVLLSLGGAVPRGLISQQVIASLKAKGLIGRDGDRYQLTRQGQWLYDALRPGRGQQ